MSFYACFIFPDTWKDTKSETVEYLWTREDKPQTRKIEYEWDDSGRFTKVLYYIDGEPVPLSGTETYNIADSLYYDNGFQKYTFTFDGGSLRFVTHNEYDSFDEYGNPLTIKVEINDIGKYVIYRTIRYR